MTFTYTHRDAQGAVRADVVEAVSRQDAFAALKAKGVTPLSVKAGGDSSPHVAAGSPILPTGRAGMARAAAAGLLVVVGAAIAWFSLAPRGRQTEEVGRDSARQAKSRPSETSTAAKPDMDAGKAEPPAPVRKEAEPSAEMNPEEPVAVETNKSGYIIETYVRDGKRTKVIKEPPPIFRNPADHVIAWMMSAQPGQEIPPFPIDKSIEEDFKRSLTNDLAVLDTKTFDVCAVFVDGEQRI